jgi:hypothetical protein
LGARDGQTQGNIVQRFYSTRTSLGNENAKSTNISHAEREASDVEEALGERLQEELGDNNEGDDLEYSDLPIQRPEPDFIW